VAEPSGHVSQLVFRRVRGVVLYSRRIRNCSQPSAASHAAKLLMNYDELFSLFSPNLSLNDFFNILWRFSVSKSRDLFSENKLLELPQCEWL
jgi:hypothetical protein